VAADRDLRPVPDGELVDALAYCLQFEGRKRVHHADEIIARAMAARLMRAMERAGLVVLKKPAVGPMRAP
jgi:hypothetical protein